MQGQVNY